MFTHIVIGSNDIEASKKFYDSTFEALDVPPSEINARGRLVYADRTGRLIVTRPINGQPATAANGGTIGLHARSEDAVRKWHAAGVANGGTTCEDPPGIRHYESGDLFLAYLRDPTGNKLCAMYSVPPT
ncbi:glyoxalase [Komagataeibacter xylinus]|nr:Lactoylglutathione lyase-like lyase [Komagataeibacter xylinus E25]RFP06951.1 glyoxalase [Komagataeibacter xylinus]RFP07585.1 glyoxalase [Komagataeibacter xylinus]